MSAYEVRVLKPGYANWVGPTQQRADGTITLVKGAHNIVVDTGGPWNRQAIIDDLKKEGLSPKDIDFVVCTHGHSDHTGNNNLFPNATLMLSYDICKGDLYTFHDFTNDQPYVIDDEIKVIATPGHTAEDVSVIVRTPKGVYAITGDLFESSEDLKNDGLWRSFSNNPELQERNRLRILDHADYIVPGHGDMFEVNRGKARSLAQQK
jgi:glyoxylase-like metal-dependent hydrolase (beta-lactamase superfamily II)